ncbi:ROK family protein [Halobacillus shinanisalinarum]|uniref:ROK family protein n=1 Tax=Halobacillus shinanisalinarum TaxID=2932258 RepID=UPI0029622691|nr:ROK family protein [Halobacillus shinanisalinarum]
MKYAIGIDIGGTKVEAGIVSEEGFLIQKEKVKSDPSDEEKMFSQVIRCIEQLMNHCSIPQTEISGVGVGIPGKVDREEGTAIFQNNLPWKDFPLVDRLRQVLSFEHITIDNDVYMAAFAEWREAGARDEELFVYMTISTGISCSIIKGGEFIRGAGFAGEVGLIPVLGTDQRQMVRLEQTASGPALQTQACQIYADEHLMTKDLFKKYNRGETKAEHLVHGMISSTAQALYMINSLLDPHKIVLGGVLPSITLFC